MGCGRTAVLGTELTEAPLLGAQGEGGERSHCIPALQEGTTAHRETLAGTRCAQPERHLRGAGRATAAVPG